MPRTARASVGNVCYHVINRGNLRATVFHNKGDYGAFVTLLGQAIERVPMRILAYCLMPNHFHLVLWPHGDGDLSCFMQWLLTSHVRRYHRLRETSGHVWQGRFKAFPVEGDDHLLTVVRYVERNPLRAGLVERAEAWEWSSAPAFATGPVPSFLHVGPVSRGEGWRSFVNRPQTAIEQQALERSLERGTPFGGDKWVRRTAIRLGLDATLRPRGRPRVEQTK